MANPFENPVQVSSAGDTSPGGASDASINPFEQAFGASWDSGVQTEKVNNLKTQQAAAEKNADQQNSTLGFAKNAIAAAPAAAWDTVGGIVSHPIKSILQAAPAAAGGVLDAPVDVLNTLSKVGTGTLKAIYGSVGLHSDQQPIDLPLPGQTFNEYIGNNSTLAQGFEQGGQQAVGYATGEGVAEDALGLGKVIIDASGNTVTKATLASRVAGNVIGGQLVNGQNENSLPDVARQATFDAAFGIADTAARAVIGPLVKNAALARVAKQAVTDAKGSVMNGAIETFSNPANPAYNLETAGKLQDFLNSSQYNKASNMNDFELGLQKAVGDDADTLKAIQPVIDAGHAQVAQTVARSVPAAAAESVTNSSTEAPTLENGGIIARGEVKAGDNVRIKSDSGEDIVGTVDGVGGTRSTLTVKEGGVVAEGSNAKRDAQQYIFVKDSDGNIQQINIKAHGLEIHNTDFKGESGDAAPSKSSPSPSANQPLKPQDLFNLKVAGEKVANRANAKPPETRYVPKDNLGNDAYGNKKLATTEVDKNTGNAIVTYDKSLDANPDARKIVFDHEQGHILDKRLNGGNNLSAEIGNYTGNKDTLDKALMGFAQEHNMTVPEAAAGLKTDIGVLGGDGPVNEQFADAVAAYRADPQGSLQKAPTFSRLMEYVPQDANISSQSTSMESLKQDSPFAAKQLSDGIKEGQAAVETHVAARGDVVSVNGKHYQLSGDSLQKYTDAKTAYDESTAKLKETVKNGSGSSAEYAAKRLKAEGMQFSALKRELTGDLTSTEIANKFKYEQSNYSGKEVAVEVNGKQVNATIIGKPAYGNIKVQLEDGTELSVKTSSIKDVRPVSYIKNEITARPDVKKYNPYKPAGEELAAAKTAEAEGKPAPKPKAPASPKIASTGLGTGKKIEGKLSFNPDKINAPQDVETLFSKMEAENSSFSDQRISKSNEDIKDLSRLVGLKPDDLINAKPGSIANAETLTAARQLVLNKAQSFADNLKGINIDTASDKQLQGLKEDYAQLVAMQQTVAGLRSEAANTLRSLQIEIQPGEDFTLKTTFGALQKFGGKMGWDTSAFAGKVGDDMQQGRLQKVGSAALKTWYASILSGPSTYLRHFIGVGANQFIDTISKGFNINTAKELPTAFITAMKSVPEAFAEVKKVFGSGAENPNFNFNETKNVPVFSGKGPLSNGANATIEFTGRAMTSLAAGYKTVSKSVEDASLKVYSPKMTDEVAHALSSAYADQINYLGEPKGLAMQGLLAGAKSFTNKFAPGKLLIPFTRVASNIIDRQFDYLPGTSIIRAFNLDGQLSQQADAIMTKYELTGAVNKTAIFQRLQDQQMGRMIMGITLATPIAIAAHAGMVSGNGPSDYNQKVELEQSGWQPNSFKLGNVWIPSAFLGPLSGLLNMAGNISDAGQYDQNIASSDYLSMIGKGMLGWGQSEISNSFLSGVSNLLAALSDPSKGATYGTTLLAGLTPIPKLFTFAVGAERTVTGQEYQYATTNVIDKIRAEIGLTGGVGDVILPLEPSNDALGRPLNAQLIYGLQPSITKPDLVDNYLQANDIVVTIPAKGTKYTDPSTGKKIAMTTAQYNTYTKQSGELIYQNLAAMIPDLQGEDIDTQRAEIRAMLDEVRSDTRDQVLSSKQ